MGSPLSIEKELQKLFDSQKKSKQMKSCLFNLIIYSSDHTRATLLRQSVQGIINKFPCRILFIEEIDNASNLFTTSVSSLMTGVIACDQIDIVCSKDKRDEVPFVILPHFIPDLPIYLLWGEDPTHGTPFFSSLIKYIDRLIFDSENVTNLHEFSKKLLEEMKNFPFEFMDIQWAMLKGWREALSDVFDTEERISNLYKLKEVHLFYTATNRNQSLYFLSWLMSVLDYKFCKMETIDNVLVIEVKGNETTATLFFHPEPREEVSGTIFDLEITTTNGASYCLRKGVGEQKVLVHISDEEKCELPFTLPLPDLHRGLTFINEVFFAPSSRHYQKMLQYVQTLPL